MKGTVVDPSAPEQAAPGRPRDGRRQLWLIAGVAFSLLMLMFSARQWWIDTGAGRHTAPPIPPGEYVALEVWETPTEDLGPDTRFVFAQTVDEDAETSRFWYGAPTEQTTYLLNGSTVDKASFEQALAEHPPAGMSASVEVEGQLSRLDAYVPVP